MSASACSTAWAYPPVTCRATPTDDVEAGTTTEGDSHGWLAYFAGEWNSIDPNCGAQVGPRHVVVAHGRGDNDAAPLTGMHHGARVSALHMRVDDPAHPNSDLTERR